jgi:HlyD family secretion protein
MSGHGHYGAGFPVAVGLVALALLVGGVGTWSVRTKIAGAVIASGMIVVESNRQVVQHAEGGTVAEILARDGARVAAGEVLLRLDGAALAADLAKAETQLVELRARRARLEAGRDGLDAIGFDAALLVAASGDAAGQIAGQTALFEARRETLARELAQIGERVAQTRNQIDGIEAQLGALSEQEALVAADLADQETLLEKGLVQAQRVSALRRDAAGLAGEIGRLRSEAARARGQIAALHIEALKLRTERREAAIETIRDLEYRELELGEERRLLLTRLDRLEVRAPVAGIVYGSAVFALGAVVEPAAPLMYVIPQDIPLVVAARIEAIHVDQVHVGQPATLRFTAFNQRLTPEVEARVTSVSADVFVDDATGRAYYRVELTPLTEGLTSLKDRELLPGMPVEAYLRTDERTPLSYLTKPMADYFGRALREG